MEQVQHHKHIRKRIYKNLEQYPSPNPMVRFLDRAIFVVGIMGPVMTIPQILQIWSSKDASSLSLISWSSYFVFSLFWITYGIVHREKPIIVSNVLALTVQAVIIFGIYLY